MPRYKLTIAYDGTDFSGWQKQHPPVTTQVKSAKLMGDEHDDAEAQSHDQANADQPHLTLRTVQEVVERAVRMVVREPVNLLGASRTDAGVHARGQVAAFTCTDAHWPAERGVDRLVRALNGKLPGDVLVLDAQVADPAFDPISDCTSKGYAYRFHVSPQRPLFDRRYLFHVWTPVDVARMNQAAELIVGEHDFAAFAAAGHGRLTTVRRVLECRVAQSQEASGFDPSSRSPTNAESRMPNAEPLTLHISGTGFLWNMVRIIAGTLLEVGRGRLDLDRVRRALETGDRSLAGPTLPPEGLCLEWIRYDRVPSRPPATEHSA